MNNELYMLNGAAAIAVPAAETGSAAVMETKPEAQVNTNVSQPSERGAEGNGAATENTQTGAGGAMGEATGSTAASSQTGTTSSTTVGGEGTGSSTAQTSGNNAVEGGNGGTGTDAGMEGGDVGNMTGEAGMIGGGDTGMDGMAGMDGINTETGTSSSVTQSMPAMIGITAGVLALSILVGIVLAKLKIKKGINLYED